MFNKIIFALIFIITFSYFLSDGRENYITPQNPLELAGLSAKMERDLNLHGVTINEIGGNILETRVKAPDNISKNILVVGTTYIFDYLESVVNKKIEKIRIIYSVNNSDVSIFEASLSDISLWKNKSIDNRSFASKIVNVDL